MNITPNDNSINPYVKCSRCMINQVEYKCANCPISINSFCSQCDTVVHCIKNKKFLHNRTKIKDNINSDYMSKLNPFRLSVKGGEQNEIDHLNKMISLLKENRDQLMQNLNSMQNENSALKEEIIILQRKLKSKEENEEELKENSNMSIRDMNSKMESVEQENERIWKENVKLKRENEDYRRMMEKWEVEREKREKEFIDKEEFSKFKIKEKEREKKELMKNNADGFEGKFVNRSQEVEMDADTDIDKIGKKGKIVPKSYRGTESKSKEIVNRFNNVKHYKTYQID